MHEPPRTPRLSLAACLAGLSSVACGVGGSGDSGTGTSLSTSGEDGTTEEASGSGTTTAGSTSDGTSSSGTGSGSTGSSSTGSGSTGSGSTGTSGSDSGGSETTGGDSGGSGTTDGDPDTRDPRTWPFAWDSIWNVPIHDDAVFAPAGIDRMGYLYTDDDVIIMAPDAPATDVYENFKDWSTQTAGARCGIEGSLLGSLPIPTDLVIPHEQGTPNMAAAVLLADGRTLHQSQPFHRCSAGMPATSHYVFPEDDIVTGDGIPGAHGGSAMSSLGGTIRVGELVPGGTIRHVLKIGIHGSYLAYDSDDDPGYRWPARAADSAAATCYTRDDPQMEMGVLLALEGDFVPDSLQSEPGRIMARAFQDYGAYVTDVVNCGDENSWWGTVVMTEWGTGGRVRDEFAATWGYEFGGDESTSAWTMDMFTILTSLQVVTNNSATTIGGGPTADPNRRAPFAPCLPGETDCP